MSPTRTQTARGSDSASPTLDGITPTPATIGAVLCVLAALIRATTTSDPFPFWDADPTRAWTPMTGFGPASGIGLDLVVILGAATVVYACGMTRLRTALLFLAGTMAVAIHAVPWFGGLVDHAPMGSAWIAGMAAAIGLSALPQTSKTRRICAAVATGVLAMLLTKAAAQVLIDHRITVESFQANKAEIFASRGWTPDSSMARSYERRLLQPDPGAWFGLSNVLASFFAAGVVGFAVGAWRSTRDRVTRSLSAALAIACAAGLVATGSKGGIGAAGLGLLASIAMAFLARSKSRSDIDKPARNPGDLIAVGAVLLVLAGVIARGVVGERIGELSLLFRSFYMHAAARVFMDHPLLGVGPDGFRDAYALAKPAISPESVTSPHSVGFDWLATLGLGGLAWIALGLTWVWNLGKTLASAPDPEEKDKPEPPTGREIRLLILFVIASFAPSLLLEQAMTTPEAAALKLLGVALWVAAAWLVLRMTNRALAGLLGAIALVIAIHGQIEMTPTWINAAPLVGVLFGLARCDATAGQKSQAASQPESQHAGRPASRKAIAFASVGLGSIAGLAALPQLIAWQAKLSEAASIARPVGELSNELARANAGGSPSVEIVAQHAAQLAGTPTPRTPDQIASLMEGLRQEATRRAAPLLAEAAEARPGHVATARAAGTAYVRSRPGGITDAIRIAEHTTETRPESGGAWTVLANLRQSADNPPATIEAWERAYALDPQELIAPRALMLLFDRLNKPEEASIWADRLLEADANKRLDPLVGLSDPERAEAIRIRDRKGGPGGTDRD